VYYHGPRESFRSGTPGSAPRRNFCGSRISSPSTSTGAGKPGPRRGAGIRGDEGRGDLPQSEPRLRAGRGSARAERARREGPRRGGGRIPGGTPEQQGPLLLAAAGPPECDSDPHIGGSTEEAQQGIGGFVAARLLEYLSTGSTSTSVNFPALSPSSTPQRHRFATSMRTSRDAGEINDLFARHGVNIAGQRLETRRPPWGTR